MEFPQLVGASYESQSSKADCQRAGNLYPENVESGDGKNKAVLYGTPGYALFLDLSVSDHIRGMGTLNGHIYVAAGTHIYDVISSGLNLTESGTIVDDGLPVQFVSNSQQWLIVSGGEAYMMDGAGLHLVTPSFIGSGNAVACAYIDGFFVLLAYDSVAQGGRKFYISAIDDASTWDVLDVATVYGSANKILNMVEDHEELWFFGERRITVYTDTGNASFPFDPRKDAVIEQGCAAKYSVKPLDKSLFWLGSDYRGGGKVYRTRGYDYERVSDHSIEQAMRGYSTIADAEAWTYAEAGHEFYVLYFPTANKTWAYDTTTSRWHERFYWDGAAEQAHHARCQAFCFQKNIIGDRTTGKLYELKLSYYSDAGQSIRRERVAPHISTEGKRQFYSRLRLDTEPGATWDLDYSNDGGTTYGSVRTKVDTSGDTQAHPEWNALGSGLDRVFRLRTTSATKIGLLNAYLEIETGAN